MEKDKKKNSEIPMIFLVVVLIINFVIYKIDTFAGGLFFAFFGVWFLGYAAYKIIKGFSDGQ